MCASLSELLTSFRWCSSSLGGQNRKVLCVVSQPHISFPQAVPKPHLACPSLCSLSRTPAVPPYLCAEALPDSTPNTPSVTMFLFCKGAPSMMFSLRPHVTMCSFVRGHSQQAVQTCRDRCPCKAKASKRFRKPFLVHETRLCGLAANLAFALVCLGARHRASAAGAGAVCLS